jgi:hypothetical protein
VENETLRDINRPHPIVNALLFLCAVAIFLLFFSLISYISLVLRSTFNLAIVIEHNGVISRLRLQAFCCLITAVLSGIALKLNNSNRLATICLVASLACGSGYLLLDQFIRSTLGWR